MTKEELDKLAKDKYVTLSKTMRGNNKSNAVDMIKKKGIKHNEITSDMLLFKEVNKITGQETKTYFNRIEMIIKKGHSSETHTINI